MNTEQLVHDLGDTLQRTLSPDAAIRNPYVPLFTFLFME